MMRNVILVLENFEVKDFNQKPWGTDNCQKIYINEEYINWDIEIYKLDTNWNI